jgi:hypothetical protein
VKQPIKHLFTFISREKQPPGEYCFLILDKSDRISRPSSRIPEGRPVQEHNIPETHQIVMLSLGNGEHCSTLLFSVNRQLKNETFALVPHVLQKIISVCAESWSKVRRVQGG